MVLLGLAARPAGAYRTLDDKFAPPIHRRRAVEHARRVPARAHPGVGGPAADAGARRSRRVFGEIKRNDYIVEGLLREPPGFLVTGNLYRPIGDGPFPAVLAPHGHWAYGRLENTTLNSVPGRAINLARQGFVVFTYDMIGYDDSRQLPHTFGGKRETLWGLSLAGLQLWNSIRSLDFLQSLPYVQRDALAVTGESGGGTQTFLLAAVDDRVKVAVPVNMISLHMQGGCLCENPPALRLDTTNVEIAATIAPRPLLMISATGDWTANTLERSTRRCARSTRCSMRPIGLRRPHPGRAQLQQGIARSDVRVAGAMDERRPGGRPGARALVHRRLPRRPARLPSAAAATRSAHRRAADGELDRRRQTQRPPTSTTGAARALRHSLGFGEVAAPRRASPKPPVRPCYAGNDAGAGS